MAKICLNCDKRITLFSADPYEIEKDQILCYDCANPIKEKMIKLYYAKTKNEFTTIKKSVLTTSKKYYNEHVYAIINETIKNIYNNITFEETNDNEEIKEINNEELEITENNQNCEKLFKEKKNIEGIIYSIDGVRGKHLDVYEDKIVINTKLTIGSFITHNATDAEKTIYYIDCIGVQYKKSGALIGYLQLETSSTQMNNRNDNFFSENSFTYDLSKISNEEMTEIVNYIKKRINTYKTQRNTSTQTYSTADEIKKFKELLDLGIITKDEFEIKKKQLLNS